MTISILNYQWQNAFNPFQCSVRSLFNVFHLPSNHKAIKTLHTSFCLQPQYTEPKEKLTSVQQTLELTFSSLRSSLPPLWTIHSRVSCIPRSFIKVWFFVFNCFCVVFIFNNVCVICSLLCGFCIQCLCGFINPWFNTIVSTSSSVEIQHICEFTLYFPADHA